MMAPPDRRCVLAVRSWKVPGEIGERSVCWCIVNCLGYFVRTLSPWDVSPFETISSVASCQHSLIHISPPPTQAPFPSYNCFWESWVTVCPSLLLTQRLSLSFLRVLNGLSAAIHPIGQLLVNEADFPFRSLRKLGNNALGEERN